MNGASSDPEGEGRPGDDERPEVGSHAGGSGGDPSGSGAPSAEASDAGQAPPDEQAPPKPPTPMTQQLGRVAIVVLAVLFGIFAVANSQPVDFSWIVGETLVEQTPAGETQGGVPLIVLLLAAFAFGAAIGALLEWQFLRTRRARRAARREQR